MAKRLQIGTRKAAGTVARKARAGRSASVMKPEYLAMLEDFRLMDDDFMSKCLENAPECIELMLRIIIGKKDANALKPGEDFGKLRDTYVIFITENDVMGGGKEIYEIDRTIRQTRGKKFGDGTHIIYVNGARKFED